MIRIGLNQKEKQREIDKCLNGIKKVFCFYYKDFPVKFNVDCEIEYIEYADIEMYKFFYRLLEEIGNDSLIIMDGCMRTQNRSELIYNCAHHYLNQTPHKIIFEHFPIIDTKDDFMILLDFENKGKYKGKGFDWDFLKQEDIFIKYLSISLNTITTPISGKNIEDYKKQKEKLFNDLGSKDPDTIPRNLHIWAGNLKRTYIDKSMNYIARNDRFKLPNVLTYKKADMKPRIIIDFPYRRIDFNDYLKLCGINKFEFMNTGLPIDEFYQNEFIEWEERVREFVQASICK
jgi:hypothetical protein